MLSLVRNDREIVPLDELGDEVATLAAAMWANTARFLALLAEFDSREGWAHWGIQSCAHWLSWRCGLSPVAAREHVRVARALLGLPRIAAAFGTGELSYSKVRAITRVACRETEGLLLEWARHGTAAQIERFVRGYRRVRALEDPERLYRDRTAEWYFDDEGCLVIKARLAPDDGALVGSALEAAEQLMAGSGPDVIHNDVSAGTVDDEGSAPWQKRRADALTEMARRSLSGTSSDEDARALVVLHADTETLGGRCTLERGGDVAIETARRLACDAGLLRVGSDGQTIGRRTRVVPAAMRGHCGAVTDSADSPRAAPAGSMPITSSIGRAGAIHHSRTSCCCAGATIGSCTREGSVSRWLGRASLSSADRTVA